MSTLENDISQKDRLYSKLKGGPHGLGDPEDKTLRKVEIDVMIPKKMKSIAHEEKCVEQFAKFRECCKATNLTLVFKCRKENTALKSCLERWYYDDDFRERCTQEYLQERSEFRRTGITKKQKKRLESSGF
ncbi:COX assembly mitochondrial-like protein [Armadillidium nasatum]|uniref:COX assembly mitochondrial protein n=1 Tax=Armadillidium nasatum TaxID=96803 RepID=A0A5N5SV10_9CRUS|nr:COX assembly mitochondrial-like protein [Armadillidium nasatum]